MGRDLHDGALHALAGVASSWRTLVRTPVVEARDWRVACSRSRARWKPSSAALRMMITHLRSRATWSSEGQPSGPSQGPCRALERQRGLRVEWSATDVDALHETNGPKRSTSSSTSPGECRAPLRSIVLRLEVALETAGSLSWVADNGHGFPFKGRYDLVALTALHVGPATLKERVAQLDGSLTVDSTERGTRLEISLSARPRGGDRAGHRGARRRPSFDAEGPETICSAATGLHVLAQCANVTSAARRPRTSARHPGARRPHAGEGWACRDESHEGGKAGDAVVLLAASRKTRRCWRPAASRPRGGAEGDDAPAPGSVHPEV